MIKIKPMLLMLIVVSAASCNAKQNQKSGNQPKGSPPSTEQIFTEMDSNKDGKLSPSEVKGPIKNDFSKIDSNNDGFITKEELEKAPKPERKGPPPSQNH